jgi:TPR repeat protein
MPPPNTLLGNMYDNGQGVPRNDKTALKWWKLAAEQGNASAQVALGIMYSYGEGVPQNDKTAVKWWTLAAEQGDADAQSSLGRFYENGMGIGKNNTLAHLWYSLAQYNGDNAAGGHLYMVKQRMTAYEISQAENYFNRCIQRNYKNCEHGISTSTAPFLRKWTPLAEQGNADAQYNLGLMFQKGHDVPMDYKAAVKWYRLAAEQGYAAAQVNLASMYDNGQGVLQDDKAAVKWYKFAAEQGDAVAQFNLGLMYDYGEGIPQDNVYAHIWGNLAASNGNEKGGKLRDMVAKKMTPSQLETAQNLARECVSKKYKGC